MTYQLLDSGDGQKLEQFGPYTLVRPCAQAVWKPTLPSSSWDVADATFSRDEGNRWEERNKLPEEWTIEVEGITFRISPTPFGHLGLFPEQRSSWQWIQQSIQGPCKLLNLFAYSGGSSLAGAKAGAEVTHLDASRGMVDWAAQNAKLNDVNIRWMVDDAMKFLAREERRGNKYDALILDPPTFGRGSKGEIFKIEEEINTLLSHCRALLSDKPLFVLFSCHTPGFSPLVMHHLLHQTLPKGEITSGEMTLTGESALPVPSGTYARWRSAH